MNVILSSGLRATIAAIVLAIGSTISSPLIAADTSMTDTTRHTTDGKTITADMLDPATSAKGATSYALWLGQQSMLPLVAPTRREAIELLRPFFGPEDNTPGWVRTRWPYGETPDLTHFQKLDAMAIAQVWIDTASAADVPVEDGDPLMRFKDTGLYPSVGQSNPAK